MQRMVPISLCETNNYRNLAYIETCKFYVLVAEYKTY